MLYGYRHFHWSHKKDGICEDIAKDVETRLDTLNYELNITLQERYRMKDELGGKIMKEFVKLRAKI